MVQVNIDEGYVIVPDSIHLSPIPEPYYTQILNTLKMVGFLQKVLLNLLDLAFVLHTLIQLMESDDKKLS